MDPINQPNASPSNPAEALSWLEADTIELFVRNAHFFGLSKSVGEIYGLLFVSATPLPLDDIRTKLIMSSGSVSQGLRLLRAVGAVVVTYVPGDRRDHFVAETGLRKIVIGFLREKIEPTLACQEERLQRLSSLLAEIPANHRRLAEDRIRILQDWCNQARAFLPIAVSRLNTEAHHQ